MELSIELEVPSDPLTKGTGVEVVAREQVRAMQKAVVLVEGAIVPEIPVNTGLLAKGTRTEIRGQAMEVQGRIYNPLAHALPMEHGSSKRWWPPIGPLVQWARRRFSIPEKEARSVGFLVARAISRRGLEGRHFFETGREKAEPGIRSLWRDALKRIRDGLTGGRS